MTTWLRQLPSGTRRTSKWHAEETAWSSYCGRYTNPDFEHDRVEKEGPPMDTYAVCMHCLRAIEVSARMAEKRPNEAIAVLRSLRDGDEAEQRSTMELLRKELGITQSVDTKRKEITP